MRDFKKLMAMFLVLAMVVSTISMQRATTAVAEDSYDTVTDMLNAGELDTGDVDSELAVYSNTDTGTVISLLGSSSKKISVDRRRIYLCCS